MHVISRHTLRSELHALLASAHKEWLIFRRYPSWVIAFFIWPVLLPFGYIFAARALGGPNGSALGGFQALTGTSDYVSFIIVGSLMWQWLNLTLWDLGFYLRNEQLRGTLESNWLCPTSRFSLIVGASITKILTSLVFLAITMLEFWLFFGLQLWSGNLALLLLVFCLLLPTIYGIGISFGSLVIRFKEANAMVFLVRGIFMVFCGITYPLAILPGWMQAVAAYLPLTYAIRDIRAIMLNHATFSDLLPDLQKLVVFGVALPVLGYLIFIITERRARRSGTLGQY